MRIHVIPPVRMLWIVTMKLIAPASDAIVSRWSARIQQVDAVPGLSTRLGERRVTRPAALRRAARGEEAEESVRPPKRKNQYDIAFSRGNATSRAPIISGTRKLPKPARIGTTTRKTIVVPWIVNSSS